MRFILIGPKCGMCVNFDGIQVTMSQWLTILDEQMLIEYSFNIDAIVRHYLPYECLRKSFGFVTWEAASSLRMATSVTSSVTCSTNFWGVSCIALSTLGASFKASSSKRIH